MFFQRKGRLRQEFDEKLVRKINGLKNDWDRNSHLLENSFDPLGEFDIQVKISGAKYVYLLKEAKKRRVSVIK